MDLHEHYCEHYRVLLLTILNGLSIVLIISHVTLDQCQSKLGLLNFVPPRLNGLRLSLRGFWDMYGPKVNRGPLGVFVKYFYTVKTVCCWKCHSVSEQEIDAFVIIFGLNVSSDEQRKKDEGSVNMNPWGNVCTDFHFYSSSSCCWAVQNHFFALIVMHRRTSLPDGKTSNIVCSISFSVNQFRPWNPKNQIKHQV